MRLAALVRDAAAALDDDADRAAALAREALALADGLPPPSRTTPTRWPTSAARRRAMLAAAA